MEPKQKPSQPEDINIAELPDAVKKWLGEASEDEKPMILQAIAEGINVEPFL